MSEGDLGLGTVAQLDICTGTAVCSRTSDVTSGSTVDAEEGGEGEKLLFLVDVNGPITVMTVKRFMSLQKAQTMIT